VFRCQERNRGNEFFLSRNWERIPSREISFKEKRKTIKRISLASLLPLFSRESSRKRKRKGEKMEVNTFEGENPRGLSNFKSRRRGFKSKCTGFRRLFHFWERPIIRRGKAPRGAEEREKGKMIYIIRETYSLHPLGEEGEGSSRDFTGSIQREGLPS